MQQVFLIGNHLILAFTPWNSNATTTFQNTTMMQPFVNVTLLGRVVSPMAASSRRSSASEPLNEIQGIQDGGCVATCMVDPLAAPPRLLMRGFQV